jgi:excinuclease UvrABC nuclease subunit
LIVVDGGKGQLSSAYAALREVGLDRLVAIGSRRKKN